MHLLTSFIPDVLSPKPGDRKQYLNFVQQHMLLSVSAAVSQAPLAIAEGEDRESVDRDVTDFIDKLGRATRDKRGALDALMAAMHLNAPKAVQNEEPRAFITKDFQAIAKSLGLSSRELVLSSMRASAFFNCYGMLESSLVWIYREVIPQGEQKDDIAGGKTIDVALRNVLMNKNLMEAFVDELARRSQFFVSFETLMAMWDVMSLVRNRLAHSNGVFSRGVRARFSESVEAVAKTFGEIEGRLPFMPLLKELTELDHTITSTGRLVFTDALENCIRNLAVFVMESLIVVERAHTGRAQSPTKRPKAHRRKR